MAVLQLDDQQFPLIGDTTRIGSGADADVAIFDTGIDKSHPDLNVVVFDSANPDFYLAHYDTEHDPEKTASLPAGPTGLIGTGLIVLQIPLATVLLATRAPHVQVTTAGTHVISRDGRMAAVGNVMTNVDFRGRGYAKQTTSAVTSQTAATAKDAVYAVTVAVSPRSVNEAGNANVMTSPFAMLHRQHSCKCIRGHRAGSRSGCCSAAGTSPRAGRCWPTGAMYKYTACR